MHMQEKTNKKRQENIQTVKWILGNWSQIKH